jgi:hypothetical protein
MVNRYLSLILQLALFWNISNIMENTLQAKETMKNG